MNNGQNVEDLLLEIETAESLSPQNIRDLVSRENTRQHLQFKRLSCVAILFACLFGTLGWALNNQADKVRALVGSPSSATSVELEEIFNDVCGISMPEHFQNQLTRARKNQPMTLTSCEANWN